MLVRLPLLLHGRQASSSADGDSRAVGCSGQLRG
ncbi:hypothetical protein ABH931_000969 [Streptacidiphilus sp. MAP12-33]